MSPSTPIAAADAVGEIYLDANATTRVLPAAAQAAFDAMELSFGNPSSSHITGIQAKQLMESTRQLCRDVIGAGQGRLIFTSGATEGIQTAVLSALVDARDTGRISAQSVLLYGATEHKAVPMTLAHWNRILGIHAQILEIPVDERGLLDHQFIAEHAADALMICTMAVNNETGVYQDIAALDRLIRAHNPHTRWMVDCVQALGKLPLDLRATTIDYAPFSGHKLYAPKGIGWIYIREHSPLTPVIAGGGQESGQRSGTENIPGMAALRVVLAAMAEPAAVLFHPDKTLQAYRRQLADALRQAFGDVVFNNAFDCSVPTTLNFAVPGFSSKEIMDLFDAAGIRVSSGSACSSKVTRSFVLDAMGLPSWQSESAIRLSFGPAMSQAEVDQACQRISQAGQALKRSCLVLSDQSDDSDVFGVKGLLQLKHGGSCSWLYCDEASNQCVIIDPLPALAQRLDTLVRCRQLKLLAVLDSHGHADHLSCRSQLQQLLAEAIPADYRQTDALGWPLAARQAVTLGDGDTVAALAIGELMLARTPLPGHTNDSVGLLLGRPDANGRLAPAAVDYAFLGDTVLIGTLGRSNFANSDPAAMHTSLNRLTDWLGDDTLICPAHDYHHQFVTTLAAERRHNALLHALLDDHLPLERFLVEKNRLDSQLRDDIGEEIRCGAAQDGAAAAMATEIDAATLRRWLAAQAPVTVVDIREPHEYSLSTANPFGAGNHFTNVPLTRLVQFVSEWRRQSRHQPLVFICRSGSRSLLAANALRRLGFEQITHVRGGFALS